MKSVLHSSVKAAIREELAEAIFNGAEGEEYRAVANSLAKREGAGWSEVQVLSIGAHLKIKAATLLKAHCDTPSEVKSFISLWYYLKKADISFSSEEARQISKEFGGLSLNAKPLAELLAHFDGLVDGTGKVRARPKQLTRQKRDRSSSSEIARIIQEPTQEKTVDCFRGASGDLVDYNTPVKELWRLSWASFIADSVPEHERSTAKVLCLPGMQCHLEIQKYIELGFKAENILAIEGGSPETRAVFCRNAERLGIRYRLGRLEALASELTEPFRVVNLDFLGAPCARYYEIISQLPIADKCTLILNVLGKREGSLLQKNLAFFSDNAANLAREKPADIADLEKPSNDYLATLRRSVSDNSMMRGLGVRRSLRDYWKKANLEEEGYELPKQDLLPIVSWVAADPADNLVRKVLGNAGYSVPPARQLVFTTAVGTGALQPLRLERVNYFSDISKKSSAPYHSSYWQLERPQDLIQQSANVCKFMVKLIYLMSYPGDRVGLQVVRQGSGLIPDRPIPSYLRVKGLTLQSPKSRLCITFDNRVSESIEWGVFYSEINQARDSFRRRFMDFSKIAEVKPRPLKAAIDASFDHQRSQATADATNIIDR